jgi:hypothetical protein
VSGIKCMDSRLTEHIKLRQGCCKPPLNFTIVLDIALVLGGGNTSVILASCAEHFKWLGGACREGRAIFAQPR